MAATPAPVGARATAAVFVPVVAVLVATVRVAAVPVAVIAVPVSVSVIAVSVPAAALTRSPAEAARAPWSQDTCVPPSPVGLALRCGVDHERATVDLRAVHGLDRSLRLFRRGKFHEAEASRTAAHLVDDDEGRDHAAKLRKTRAQTVVCRRVREVPNVEPHQMSPGKDPRVVNRKIPSRRGPRKHYISAGFPARPLGQ